MNRLILKSGSACFTGHRKVFKGSKSQLKSKIRQTIVSLYERGVTCYYCGMAIGFDMLAAEVVLELKDTCPDIQLIAVVPFRRQYVRYSETDKKRYFRLLGKADRLYFVRIIPTAAICNVMTICLNIPCTSSHISTVNPKAVHSTPTVVLCAVR